jgi:hypothetical protein
MVLDFDLELAMAVLVHEESFTMTVFEEIVTMVVPAMVVEEDVVATMPAMAGVVELVIRAASPTVASVVEQIVRAASPPVTAPTAAGAAAASLGQQDGPTVQRPGLHRCDTGGTEGDCQQQNQCC